MHHASSLVVLAAFALACTERAHFENGGELDASTDHGDWRIPKTIPNPWAWRDGQGGWVLTPTPWDDDTTNIQLAMDDVAQNAPGATVAFTAGDFDVYEGGPYADYPWETAAVTVYNFDGQVEGDPGGGTHIYARETFSYIFGLVYHWDAEGDGDYGGPYDHPQAEDCAASFSDLTFTGIGEDYYGSGIAVYSAINLISGGRGSPYRSDLTIERAKVVPEYPDVPFNGIFEPFRHQGGQGDVTVRDVYVKNSGSLSVVMMGVQNGEILVDGVTMEQAKPSPSMNAALFMCCGLSGSTAHLNDIVTHDASLMQFIDWTPTRLSITNSDINDVSTSANPALVIADFGADPPFEVVVSGSEISTGPDGMGVYTVGVGDLRIADTHIEGGMGLRLETTTGVVEDSDISDGASHGVYATADSVVTLERDVIADNGGVGLLVEGKSTVYRIDTTIEGNAGGDVVVEPGSHVKLKVDD